MKKKYLVLCALISIFSISNVKAEDNLLCKRATELHKVSTKAHGNVTFGNLGTNNILAPGDAFDCDVNGDGVYNPENERFYYVSDLAGNNNYVVLLYYSSVKAGMPGVQKSKYDRFGHARTNGPLNASEELPTVNQWSNVSLTNNTRMIKDEKGNEYVEFTYKNSENINYAARFLTYDEVVTACPNAATSVDSCLWLLDQTYYVNDTLINAFWLETLDSSTDNVAFVISGYDADLSSRSATGMYNEVGVKPAIEVPISRIQLSVPAVNQSETTVKEETTKETTKETKTTEEVEGASKVNEDVAPKETVKNPKTGISNYYIIGILFICLSSLGYILLKNKKLFSK